MKPEETKILADPRQRQEQQREQPAQTKDDNDIREWFRPKMQKGAQEHFPEMRIRAIKPKGTVITVGEGRGFVVEHRGEHLVVTASHCLPWLPSGFGIAYSEEHVYRNMLGPLGSAPTVACECLFINPIADMAVVGVPDTHTYSDCGQNAASLPKRAVSACASTGAYARRSELLRHRRRPAAFFLVWKGNGLDARSSGWKGVMVRFGSQSPRNRLKVACPARRSFQKPVTPSESLQPL